MIESIILVEGEAVQEDALRISLANAKQLVIGNAPGFGFILHVAGNTSEDLNKAFLEFANVPGVSAVSHLAIHSRR
ncbi:hypothetical protein GZH53_01035 [Flavihumibacter sp. R14]|nr:hypothetical protein [Flavihumibacter soli]